MNRRPYRALRARRRRAKNARLWTALRAYYEGIMVPGSVGLRVVGMSSDGRTIHVQATGYVRAFQVAATFTR